MALPLFLSVLAIAACGLIYELVASALASYLLGDSVLQFSTVIGTYLFAMGLGSWLSRYLTRGLVARFIGIELMVGIVGGFSSTLLFLAFAYTSGFRLVLYALVVLIGILVGLEIPLLMRILRDRYAFKEVVSNVLTFDYLGALAASLAFPIVLVPRLGLVRSAMLFGLVNAAIALWSTYLFAGLLGARHVLVLGGGDGLAVREILKYPSVESVTLVDLDPEMTRLFSTHPLLTRLNGASLTSAKVHVINADAFVWLDQSADMFDFAVVDFPDPNNYSVGKLYTAAFYRAL